MDKNTERELIQRAKTDPQAFGEVFDFYYPKISNYIFHRVGEPAASQDITSTVFFKAWQGIAAFEWRGLPFSAWLYKIASNEVNSHFRSHKMRPASLEALFEASGFELPSGQELEADLIKLQDALEVHQDFVLVQQLLLELPLKYQEVLALRYFEKKPLQEVADITGKNLNTVKSLLTRGTVKLKRNFLARKTL
jgi:RNA polymerase sigma-70 factor (ECF subfamily)